MTLTVKTWITVGACLASAVPIALYFLTERNNKAKAERNRKEIELFPTKHNFDIQRLEEIEVNKDLDKNEVAFSMFEVHRGWIGDDQINSSSMTGRATAMNLGVSKVNRKTYKSKSFIEIDFSRILVTNKKVHLDSNPFQQPVLVNNIVEMDYIGDKNIVITWRNKHKIKVEFKSYKDAVMFANIVHTVKDTNSNDNALEKAFNKFDRDYKQRELVILAQKNGIKAIHTDKKAYVIDLLIKGGVKP